MNHERLDSDLNSDEGGGGNARIRPVTVPIIAHVHIRKSDSDSIQTNTENTFSPSILNGIECLILR